MASAKRHNPLIVEDHLNTPIIDAIDIWMKCLSISHLDFINIIKSGLSATQVLEVFLKMELPKRQAIKMLNLSIRILADTSDNTKRLSPGQTERVFGLICMINMVHHAVMESNPEIIATGGFDAAKWLKQWLLKPLPVIGGEAPSEFMDTIRGQNLLIKLLSQADQGTYA